MADVIEIERKPGQRVTFTVGVAKSGVDADKRTVKGIASQELKDAHGQVVDYETLKACLPAYRNNIREMHQPKAVGKAIALECDDTNQALVVESYISKGAEDTWQKCLDGTLACYSIGGVGDVVVSKGADGKLEQRVFMSALHEISLVDVGACPTATFEVVKMVDGVPTATQTDAPVKKHLYEGYDIERAFWVLQYLQQLISSEIGDVVYPSDGDGNAAAQVETLRLAAELVFDFVMSEFESQFDALAARMSAGGVAKSTDADRAFLGTLIEKKGARHSKGDVALVQKVHDNAKALGAACGEAMEKQIQQPAESAVVEKAGEGDATQVISLIHFRGEFTKFQEGIVAKFSELSAELGSALSGQVEKEMKATEERLSTQFAEHKASVDKAVEPFASLPDRIEKLEAQPMPGGPVRQPVPVDKSIGGAPANGAVDEASAIVKLAAELAPSMTPEQRAVAVQKVIAAQHVIGAIPLSR